MSGIDRNTGRVLDGFEHVSQSLHVIVTTVLGSRVMRRDFGTDLESMIDRPLNPETMVSIIIEVAEAIEPRLVGRSIYGEPRFQLRDVRFLEATEVGRLQIMLEGIYFPRGHLGDYSVVEQRTVNLGRLAEQ